VSTHSVVARQAGDGWEGRYCHSDGYPRYMVPALLALIARDGLKVVTQTLLDDYRGWSMIDPTRPDLSGIRIPHNATYDTYPYDSVKRLAYYWKTSYHNDGRFKNIPGYGIAYTLEQRMPAPLVTERGDVDSGWTHVLTQRSLVSYYRTYTANDFSTWEWNEVGRFAYGTVPDEKRLTQAECGRDYERCGHVASFHFEEAKDVSVGVGVWLGHRRPSSYDAVAGTLRDGTEVTFNGSTRTGTAGSSNYNPLAPRNTHYVWQGTKEKGFVRLGKIVGGNVALEIDLHAPTARGLVTIPAGSLV